VRLRTCIALELLFGAATLTSFGVGAVWGAGRLFDYVLVREGVAVAATAEVPAPAPLSRIAPARLEISALPPPRAELAPPPAPTLTVFGAPDDELLAPLRDAPLVKAKVNGGGTTLSLRLDFEGGARAAFKPEQVFSQSNPRREIAAYRLDRLLGLGRVAPAFARRFTVDELVAVLGPTGGQAVREQAISRGGVIAGELSWWIPTIVDAHIGGFPIVATDGIVTWRRLLKAGADRTALSDADRELVRQISDMVLFDFVTDNIDRWSGANAKASPDGRVLYYMDNTMSFSTNPGGHVRSYTYLKRVETFSRHVVDRLRALDADQLRAAMAAGPEEPLGALLTAEELGALLTRRDAALAYIDDLIAKHGEEAVLGFP